MRSQRLFNSLVVGSTHSNDTRSPSWEHFPSPVLPWRPYLYRPPGRNSCVEATSRSLSHRPAMEIALLAGEAGGGGGFLGASSGFTGAPGSAPARSFRSDGGALSVPAPG